MNSFRSTLEPLGSASVCGPASIGNQTILKGENSVYAAID